ncbi:MAG: phosphatase PAP2 family protein [Acidobacteriota bacterium]
MRQNLSTNLRVSLLTTATLLPGAWPARAQLVGGSVTPGMTTTGMTTTGLTTPAEVTAPARQPSLVRPFLDVFSDVKRLPTRDNLKWLTVGLVAAAAAYPADRRVTDNLSRASKPVQESFEPGPVLGGTPLELGAAFATYAIGRATRSPRAVSLGGDLIRAQLLAELMTTGVKQTVRRSRPEGSGFSFSSGHAAVTFASATVLQRHLGWKAGIPAYAVAGYVAASRVQMKRHYLSDVVFGAAIGLTAGRTVTVGRSFVVEPLIVNGGAGAVFTWNPKR